MLHTKGFNDIRHSVPKKKIFKVVFFSIYRHGGPSWSCDLNCWVPLSDEDSIGNLTSVCLVASGQKLFEINEI